MASRQSGPAKAANDPEWLTDNRANWDERVGIHLRPGSDYDLQPLRAGTANFHPIVQAVLGQVAGAKIAHLQCHFGADTLILVQHRADAVGLDFSGPAIEAARSLAAELKLNARFIQSDVYAAETAFAAELGTFDRVLVSWGALCWLPDIAAWARIVSRLLKPGGWLALAESHPAAHVFDDEAATFGRVPGAGGMPGWFRPYLGRDTLVMDDATDYADSAARLSNTRTHEWLHPLSDVIGGLLAAGLRLDSLTEHACVPWRLFKKLEKTPEGWWTWPDRAWLPLAYSLRAVKPLSTA